MDGLEDITSEFKYGLVPKKGKDDVWAWEWYDKILIWVSFISHQCAGLIIYCGNGEEWEGERAIE